MLLSPSSHVRGRLARRAGTALVARASFHTKPVLKKFSASHAQGQSRTTTAAFGAAQRRAFTVASYWSSVGRNSYDALIKSKGRNWLGLLLGGGAGLGVGLIIFGPLVFEGMVDTWSINHPANTTWDRPSTQRLYPYFVNPEHDFLLRKQLIGAIGIAAFACLWPLPTVFNGLLIATTLVAYHFVSSDDSKKQILMGTPVGGFPAAAVNKLAEKGDVGNWGADLYALPPVPEGEDFEKLRTFLGVHMIRVKLAQHFLAQRQNDLQQLVADGKATQADLDAFHEKFEVPLVYTRDLAHYQNFHRKVVELICLIEDGKDTEEAYKDLAEYVQSLLTDKADASYRRDSKFIPKEKIKPNIYVRPTLLRQIAPTFV